MASITTRAQTSSFGIDGGAFSTFDQPKALAFDQAVSELYVLERIGSSEGAIHAFDTPGLSLSGGSFPLAVPVPDSGSNNGLAIDNSGTASAGRIYYLNRNTNVLLGFDSTGTALGAPFPISPPAPKNLNSLAVDSAGNIAIGNNHESAKKVLRYAPDGTPLASVSVSGQEIGRPAAVAFDSSDNLYVVVTGGSTKVHRYEAPSYAPLLPPIETGGVPQTFAVDTSSDTIYVAHSNRVRVFDAASGAHLYDFARNIAGAAIAGVAIDQGTDTVYVSDGGNDKVHVFGPDQSFADATGTPVAAKEVTDTSAVIGATVADNNVFATDWRLEVSKDGGESWEGVGSGVTSSKSAQLAATGFGEGTLTVKASGGTYKLGFEAEATAPIAYNASATAVRTALEGLASIEPGEVEVSGGPGNATGSNPYTILFAGALAGTPVTEISSDPLGLVGGPETVSAIATGLDPNTTYKSRVVTNKGTTVATEVASAALSFKTVAPPPVVTDVGAIQIQDTSARLVGTIDPRNNPTGYFFEYGTTPALGSTTPPLAIGGGTAEITVSQVVKGLVKDETYYFRLVATNLTGSTASAPTKTFHTRTDPFPPANPGNCPNEARRAEQGSTHLPACRAYEMVSPPDKNQGSAVTKEADYPAAFSADGTGAFFCASAIFGEPAGQQSFTCSPYLSRRGPDGWSTSPAGPRYCNVDPDSRAGGGQIAIPSPEGFDRLYLAVPEAESCPFSPLVPGAPLPSINLYVQDLTTDPAAFDLLSPGPRVTGDPLDPTGTFGVGNRDHSHVVYASKSNQTPDSPPQDEDMKLYDWEAQGHGDCATPGGCLSLLSVRPDGSPFATDTRLPGHDINSGLHPNRQAISDDGERVYFQNETPSGTNSATGGCNAPSCDLYLREGGETTFHVSASECTSECGADSSPDVFQLADPSGEVAFFVSCAKLTDASAPATSACNGAETPQPVQQLKLYRWDRTAPPGNRLVDVTVDNEPADGVQPRAMDPIGVSEDGDTLFFVAAGQLVAGEPAPTTSFGAPEGLKLYRWQWNEGSPSVEYLAPYVSRSYAGGSGGSNGAIGRDPNIDRLHDRVTPDGRYLLVQTVARYDQAGDRDSDGDLYRWDEQNGWLCVSCQSPGTPSAGHVNSFRGSMVASLTLQYESREPEHTISDDGQRVFFSASDALVPQDTNGEEGCPVVDTTSGGAIYACQDVYEWHDGTVSLITPGTGGEPFFLMGATHTGNEVFFFTGQRLLGWDQDGGRDVYVAKRNGGFPEPAPQPPECEGEGCRETGTEAPEIAGAGSAVFQGAGNPKPEAQGNRCPANRLRRGKRCLPPRAIARKRCRRLKGQAKRRCIVKQTRRLRRANRRAQRRLNAHRANAYRRAAR